MIIALAGRSHQGHLHLEPIEALSDSTLLMAMIYLTIHHRRWWLIAAASCQLISCLGHLAALTYHPTRLGYALMTGIGGYPILTIMWIGIIAQLKNRYIASHRSATR